ncbi:MAG: response regulator [Candidatus Parcubacteria bacterium]|nr:response regulator [Candidatus Parcubacteria bacterium]
MKKILIVEDEKILAEMYQEKLIKTGFDVIASSEAEEGLEMAKTEKPDLILLDILLPRGNGIFFLKSLRNDSAISSLPVLVFSNYDDPETKQEAIKLGVKDYLIKTGYTPGEIVDKIKKYLSESN